MIYNNWFILIIILIVLETFFQGRRKTSFFILKIEV